MADLFPQLFGRRQIRTASAFVSILTGLDPLKMEFVLHTPWCPTPNFFAFLHFPHPPQARFFLGVGLLPRKTRFIPETFFLNSRVFYRVSSLALPFPSQC